MSQISEHLLTHFLAVVPGGPIRNAPILLNTGGDPIVIRAGGEFAVACQPWRTDFGEMELDEDGWPLGPGNHIRCSGEPAAVTCPACQATELYREQSGPVGGVVKDLVPDHTLQALMAGGVS